MSTDQPDTHPYRQHRRRPVELRRSLLLLCSLFVFSLLSPFVSGSTLHYPCLVCEQFLHTHIQNSLLDRALNTAIQQGEMPTVTPLPSPEQFCTSPSFERITAYHLYLDQQDNSEIERLEAQTTRNTQAAGKPTKAAQHRFAEYGLDELELPPQIELESEHQPHQQQQQHQQHQHQHHQSPGIPTSATVLIQQAHDAYDPQADEARAGHLASLDAEESLMQQEERDPMAMIELEAELNKYNHYLADMDSDLTLDEKHTLDSSLDSDDAGAADDVFLELALETGSTPSQADVARHLAQAKEAARLVESRKVPLTPIPNPIPPSSIDYYYSKPRSVCLVYSEGRCQLYDTSLSDPIDVHTLPNPFSKAFIQHTPKLLERVTKRIRARKRRQALHILSIGDKKRIERAERELLRKSALQTAVPNPFAKSTPSSKPTLPPRYRKYEECITLVTRLRSISAEIDGIVADGCTYQNRTAIHELPSDPTPNTATGAQTKPNPIDAKRSELMRGQYAWPCPLRAACNGLKLASGQPYCPTTSIPTRVQPIDLMWLSRGMVGGGVPKGVPRDPLTPKQRHDAAILRGGGTLAGARAAFKVSAGGVAAPPAATPTVAPILAPVKAGAASVRPQRALPTLAQLQALADGAQNTKVALPREA